MKYIIDTNILITAWRNTYPIQCFKGVWEWLENNIINGNIVICESVYEELKSYKDDLFNWLNDILDGNHISAEPNSTSNIITAYKSVIDQADKNKNYTRSAMEVFGANADGWVIAHALANGYVLVTEERSNMDSKKRVKIPDICQPLGVTVTNTIGLFQSLGFLI